MLRDRALAAWSACGCDPLARVWRHVFPVRAGAASDRPAGPEPPAGLIAFYWHFARQAKALFVALFVTSFCVALLDTLIPVFIGQLVTLVDASRARRAARRALAVLVGMALVLLVARPGSRSPRRTCVTNQAIAGHVTNLIRWQSHWHVVRQSWAFFQNDFAGRIANRVMQTGPAVRESLVALDHRASGTSWSTAPPR